jgi:hypothetical protein
LVVSAGYLQAQGALTPADYPAKMKQAVQANVEVQKALKAGVVADVAAPAQTASAAFADIEKFWAAQKKDDAVKLAAQARTAFSDAAAAAAKGDLMAAQMAAGNALGTCKQCHGLYREGGPQEGGYRFKAGTVQ